MVILSAVTSYYMDTLGADTIFDREMTVKSSWSPQLPSPNTSLTFDYQPGDLVSPFPAPHRSRTPQTVWNVKDTGMPVATGVLSSALTAGLLLADLKAYSSVLRERKGLHEQLPAQRQLRVRSGMPR
jgi:lipid A ethanolaminephosphotransferase